MPSVKKTEKVPVAPRAQAATTFKELKRDLKGLRLPADGITLIRDFIDSAASEEDRNAASQELVEWQERAAQGHIRHGPDWISAAEIDALREQEIQYLREAHRLMEVGNDRLAEARFHSASKINSESVRADFYLGLLSIFVGNDANAAARHFDKCVDRLRNSPDRLFGTRRANLIASLNNLAVAQVRKMQYDRAIRLWSRALELSPQTPELVQNLGLLTRLGGTGVGSVLPNRVGDKAGALYARATVANGSREYDAGRGWLYMPLIDSLDGAMSESGDNELRVVSWGTAIAVSSDVVLTSTRTTADADRFRLTGRGSATGTIVATDRHLNLAMVRFPGLDATPVRWSAEAPRVGANLSLVGFTQPGFGATALRSTPTSVTANEEFSAVRLRAYGFGAFAALSPSGTYVVADSEREIAARSMFTHSFVGDFGLIGGPLCDRYGVAYAVHLGSRANQARASDRSSLAEGAEAVLPFVRKVFDGVTAEAPKKTKVDISEPLAGPQAVLGNSVFQIAGLELAPRLQWSHRLARLHAAGATEGWASFEDPSCTACTGRGGWDCPNRECSRGRIRKYSTETEVGTGAFDGITKTKRVRYYVACPTCNGAGKISCRSCSGDGMR